MDKYSGILHDSFLQNIIRSPQQILLSEFARGTQPEIMGQLLSHVYTAEIRTLVCH